MRACVMDETAAICNAKNIMVLQAHNVNDNLSTESLTQFVTTQRNGRLWLGVAGAGFI